MIIIGAVAGDMVVTHQEVVMVLTSSLPPPLRALRLSLTRIHAPFLAVAEN